MSRDSHSLLARRHSSDAQTAFLFSQRLVHLLVGKLLLQRRDGTKRRAALKGALVRLRHKRSNTIAAVENTSHPQSAFSYFFFLERRWQTPRRGELVEMESREIAVNDAEEARMNPDSDISKRLYCRRTHIAMQKKKDNLKQGRRV